MSGSLRLVDFDAPLAAMIISMFCSTTGYACATTTRGASAAFFGWLLARSTLYWLTLGRSPFLRSLTGAFCISAPGVAGAPLKNFIMDGKVVVGVGNIYANEALFISGIRPDRAAGRVSMVRYQRLAENIKQVLTSAIDQGGTTLRDFVGGDGRPGYFAQRLLVYGRGGQPCKRCGATLREVRLGQRSSVYCATCQR